MAKKTKKGWSELPKKKPKYIAETQKPPFVVPRGSKKTSRPSVGRYSPSIPNLAQNLLTFFDNTKKTIVDGKKETKVLNETRSVEVSNITKEVLPRTPFSENARFKPKGYLGTTSNVKIPPYMFKKTVTKKETKSIDVKGYGSSKPSPPPKTQSKLEITDSKDIKKGIWVQGRINIDKPNVQKHYDTLNQIYTDASKTWGRDNVVVTYGGYGKSDFDNIVKDWANKNKVRTHVMNVYKGESFGLKGEDLKEYNKIGKKSEDFRKRLNARESQLKKMKGEGRILNLFTFSEKGDSVYNYEDRTHWYERYGELTDKFGGRHQAKIREGLLDEIEDLMTGETKQKIQTSDTEKRKRKKQIKLRRISETAREVVKQKNITRGLAGIEFLEEKANYFKEEAEDYNKMLINEGYLEYEDPNLPYRDLQDVKKRNLLKQDDILVGHYKTKFKRTEWLSNVDIKRIEQLTNAGLRSDQRIETDFADSPGIEEGTQHVVTESNEGVGLAPEKKSPDLFTRRGYIEAKTGESSGTLRLMPNVNVVDLNKSKDSVLNKTIKNVINLEKFRGQSDIKKNVFGEFFDDLKQEKITKTHENKNITYVDEGYSIDDQKDKSGEALKKEIKKFDKAVNYRKLLEGLKRRGAIETGGLKKYTQTLINQGSVLDKDTVTVLDSSFTKDKDKKIAKGGKVITNVKPWKPPTKLELLKKVTNEIRKEMKDTEWERKQAEYPQTTKKVKKPKYPIKAYVSNSKGADLKTIKKHIKGKIPRGLSAIIKKNQSIKSDKGGKLLSRTKYPKSIKKSLPSGLGALSLFSSITGILAARKKAQEWTGEKEPGFIKSLQMMYPQAMGLPKKKGVKYFDDPI